MMHETPNVLAVDSFTNVTEKHLHHTSPITSFYVLRIIGYVNVFFLSIVVGVLGIITNSANISVYLTMGLSETANISVYLTMGLSETTNISFFSLSISDMLVSLSVVLVQLTYNPPVSVMKLPSGTPVS